MKKLLAAMFVALLMVGCGGEETTKVVEEDESTSFTIADLSMDMLWVKPGTFEMGSSSGGSDETPHAVTLTQGFYLLKGI